MSLAGVDERRRHGLPPPLHTAQDEARAALQALGYKPSEADKLVDAVHEDGMAADALLRAALRRAVR